MGKGKSQQKNSGGSKKSKLQKNEEFDINDMDDEIDAFHKKNDMIPLDIDANSDESDEDDEQTVFDNKGIGGDSDDEDEFGEDHDDDDNDLDQYYNKNLAAKMLKTQKYLNQKSGGVDDDILDDGEEDENKTVGRGGYYGGENVNIETDSSDDDAAALEEEEAIRLLRERTCSMRPEDFGIQTAEDDSDAEPSLEELKAKGRKKPLKDGEAGADADAVAMYEEVKKDLNALSKDEQMDVVYSSAPELVGLLSELNDAVNELETQVNPLLSEVREGNNAKKEGMHYVKAKQLLLQAYCQAIVFYLLLKSEGQLVRDHPVIARLVELKSLLDKELDKFISDEFEDALSDKDDGAVALRQSAKAAASSSNLYTELENITGLSERKDATQSTEVRKEKQKKRKLENVSSESVLMLQHRAALEDKLKLKSVSDSDSSKAVGRKKKKLKTLNGKLETTDDFSDDVMEMGGTAHINGHASTLSSKLSTIIPAKNKKGVSGDDDLPERDNLGDRRWKHELRVLEKAGMKSKNDYDPSENGLENLGGDEDDDDGVGEDDGSESDKDLYNVIKLQREHKMKLKAATYLRNPQDVGTPDDTVDGKRYITTQIEKNRGLTRNRKKMFKNPRVKRKIKYKEAVNRRKGQVREVKKPAGPYGGETSGINARVSRSIRFKN